mmetsp:Transcript_7376/g.30553  ORF Transcript_7376/g.30553 Transcript_7376/m.30553 type:complete len:321 (-) Transcript_7376:396-1358(-)|eukprot:CAMPEP_0185712866 /NCGR_PEP_ID=MMETSP1164-20130828/35685_1 /TAXON_ID=1104430 /ORGANISM="Chrysoreinhardia sp, Strain CCMP2950" /LENGTH=320 /DNA_ID=CAMNT_0028380425 /DNA_START=36 /DNA_END=998 /DNA_ORIENTATION=+
MPTPARSFTAVLLLASCHVAALVGAAEVEATCAAGACADGVVTSGAIGDEKSQVDYYERASHYDKIWGSDNLHFGYFAHLERGATTAVELNHRQAAAALTERMMAIAGVGPGTRVLDLGAGKGRACYEIATLTGASCLGMDLTPANVERGNAIAKENPQLKLKFVEGSFTDLPEAVLAEGPFDVVFSQVAFCHVHSMLDAIFEQVKRVMGPQSILMVNDYLGSDAPTTEETRTHVFKRLHFETLVGPSEWRARADAAGLKLQRYETLDAHMARAYEEMAAEAEALGVTSTDGVALATNYRMSAKAVHDRQIGMNLALYTL